MEDLPNTVVVLPASGIGERFGDSTPKQFLPVCGKPLYIWTVEIFRDLAWVKEVYLVVSDNYVGKVTAEIKAHGLDTKVRIVEGSYARHRSIRAAVRVAYERKALTEAETIIIHDVVRPCISVEVCQSVVENARRYGACGVVRRLVSTVVKIDEDGFMENALRRTKLRASEMPQAFRLDVIHKAYETISDLELDHGHECLELAQMYNPSTCRVKLLEWHEDLFKVTYERDLLAVKALIERRNVDKK